MRSGLSSQPTTSAPPADNALAATIPELPRPNTATFLPAKVVTGIIAARPPPPPAGEGWGGGSCGEPTPWRRPPAQPSPAGGQGNRISRDEDAPSPRLRGEGRGEGASPQAQICDSEPLERPSHPEFARRARKFRPLPASGER